MRYPIISMRQLDFWIAQNRQMYLVDLRGREAYERGHLRGAVNIPFDELEDRLAELPAGLPLVFYCTRGSQSMLACNHLSDRGYQVINAAGGLNAYRGNHLVSGQRRERRENRDAGDKYLPESANPG